MITQNDLKQLLHYDPKDGSFESLVYHKNRKSGRFFGSPSKSGYLRIYVAGKLYYAHRLAWLYMTGSFPTDQIDHINFNKADNRFENLRSVTNKQNNENKKYDTLTRGAVLIKATGRYAARVKHNGKMLSFGCYDTATEAAAVAKAERLRLFTNTPE